MGVLAAVQPLQPTAAVGLLPENVQLPILARIKRYPLAIRCPNRAIVPIPLKREPGQRLAGEIVQPDLRFLLRDIHGYPPTVGGKPRAPVSVRGYGQGLLRPIPTDPHQA